MASADSREAEQARGSAGRVAVAVNAVRAAPPAIEHVRSLALDVGPRPPGSPQERRAAEYAATILSQGGVTSETDAFNAPRNQASAYAPPLLLAGVAGCLAPWFPVEAGVLAWFALLLFTLEAHGWGFIGRFAAKHESRNVWARIPSTGPSFRTLVLVAHLDSQPLPRPDWSRARMFAALASLIAVVALTHLAAAQIPLSAIAAAALGLTLAAAAVLALVRALRSGASEGADANASGLAAVLAAAGTLRERGLEHTTLEVLLTGSATSGSHGLHRFLDRFGRHYVKGRTLFLNVERVSSTPMAVTVREGPLVPVRSDAELVEAVSLGADATHMRLAREGLSSRATDARAAGARGWRAATLTTPALANEAAALDDFAHVSGRAVEDAARVIVQAALALDSGAAKTRVLDSMRAAPERPMREWRAR